MYEVYIIRTFYIMSSTLIVDLYKKLCYAHHDVHIFYI